ncbi:MAG: HTH domain-containing protein [Bacteroidia bacterium]|nr:HTH domain-containing protein [Bacteroidia bacterium]
MTGTPGELAQKLEVSERTAKRMIAQLRESGLDIRYCRYENSYILEKYH